jgi:hypothetical protein
VDRQEALKQTLSRTRARKPYTKRYMTAVKEEFKARDPHCIGGPKKDRGLHGVESSVI